MKKLVSLLLAVVMVLGMMSFAAADEAAMRVAMVTDSGDITDQSFNQTTYEACKAFCEANSIDFNYYKPSADTDPDRVAAIEMAINDGFNVIVLPGYLFGAAIQEVRDVYTDVKFIGLDISAFDLGDITTDNVFTAVYQEELSGYMAGYAAVKMGYKHLGFLGGMAVPAVIRFGFGYVQGANAAAVEMGIADQVAVEYAYGNQFFGDADITAAMDTWYQNLGVEIVFACGGGIYSSAAEAAVKANGKVIGVDTDQSGIINTYAENLTVTSAMKGLAATVNTLLAETLAGNFANFGGTTQNLGLVSGDDPTLNYVQLPVETTQWSDAFSVEDYNALVKAMFEGTVTVSNDTTAMPATTIAVTDHGNVK